MAWRPHCPGVGELTGAQSIVQAIQDEQVHDAFEEFALSLGDDSQAPGITTCTA